VAVMLAALALAACGDTPSRNGGTHSSSTQHRDSAALPTEQRVIVARVEVDVTGDGIDESIFGTRSADEAVEHAEYFDRVEILRDIDTKPRQLFIDVVDNGFALQTRDVTGDGVSDILALLDAGGNTPVSSRGMHVYGRGREGKLSLLFATENGNPEFRDIDADGCMELLVSDEYWGPGPHSDVIGFVRAVYVFNGVYYAADNARHAAWFGGEIDRLRRAHDALFRKAASTPAMETQLYTATAELLLWQWARGGATAVRDFWRGQRKRFGERLSADRMDDLETMVEDLTAMDIQQQEALP
jgi:hypothetical protein